MLNAMKLSEAIRSKRKKVKEAGIDNMLDTAPGPQMNPQDIYDRKLKADWEELGGRHEEPSIAPSDPADPELDETQKMEGLKKRMARVQRCFDKL